MLLANKLRMTIVRFTCAPAYLEDGSPVAEDLVERGQKQQLVVPTVLPEAMTGSQLARLLQLLPAGMGITSPHDPSVASKEKRWRGNI